MNKTSPSSTNPSTEQRTLLGVVVHLAAAFFGGVIFSFIISGVVYLYADDEFTKMNARNSLNWWLAMCGVVIMIWLAVTFVFQLDSIFSLLLIFGGILLMIIGLSFSIFAAMVAYNGRIW